MDEYIDLYILDDEDDMRNATRDHRTNRPSQPPPSGPGLVRARPARAIVRTPTTRVGSTRVVMSEPVGQRPSILGGLSVGELVEVAAQILAAIQPLPAAPVAVGHSETDVANLVTYQTALAQHAKRDEQLRTIGSLVGKILD